MPDLLIPGAVGRIELKFRAQEDSMAPVAILLHPHPLHGGTMNNKVLFNASKAYYESGFSTVRFNFRGVGRSAGTFGQGDGNEGEGELSDAATVLDWVQNQFPSSKRIWITGYSFGAWVAMQLLMRRPEISSFIILAPPAKTYDFLFLAPCPASGMIVYAEHDEIAPVEYVQQLIYHVRSQKVVTIDEKCVENCDHFFNGKLDQLRECMKTYINTHRDNTTVI